MNDLEERLSAELRQAVEGVESDLDATTLLASGRRARRSAVTGRVAFAAALGVVVGTAGWLVANHQARTPAPVVAGTASPSASSASAPAPSVTPGPGTATATISLSSNFNGKPGSFDEVRVAATSDGKTVHARFESYLDGKAVDSATVNASVDASVDGSGVRLVRLGSRGVVAVIPGMVRSQSLYGPSASSGGEAELGALGVTAVALVTEKPVGTGKLELAWEDGAGALQSTVGVIPSVQVILDGDPEILFRSEALDEQGIWGRWSTAVKGAKPSDILVGSAGSRQEVPTPSDWKLMQQAMLPPGSMDVELTLGSTNGDWVQATLWDGWVAVAAVVHSETDKAKVVTSLAFTDLEGVRHTYPAK